MFSTADKTNKTVNVARKGAADTSFFRKAGEESFFGAKEASGFFPSNIQAKLSVSQPDDPMEKEADAVAETVMRMLETVPVNGQEEEQVQMKAEAGISPVQGISLLQRQESDEEEEVLQTKSQGIDEMQLQRQEEDEEVLQAKSDISIIQKQESSEEEELQLKSISNIQRKPIFRAFSPAQAGIPISRKGSVFRKNSSLFQSDLIQLSGRGPPASSIQFENNLQSSKGGGSAMPETTRSFMESRFDADFSGVRIHTGTQAELLSRDVHAHAFTHGNDIYFNSGKFSPNTADGGNLLAHELTHTIQQGAVSNAPVAKKRIQRSAIPQLDNAVAKAKGEVGKVNAGELGPDGNRIGWERLLEYFKTTFGEDKIVKPGAPFVQGTINEMVIKKMMKAEGMRPNQERPSTSNTYMRDAMPSWCGIFAFWALNKGGVPLPKWVLGGNIITPDSARAPGEKPKPGDIAYIDKNSHYALVEKTDGTNVSTINGNTSGEDNLGAQVQVKDHPVDHWKAFFDPIKLKTGELRSGEGAIEAKPKTLAELRRELFNVSRKGNAEEEISEETIQAKNETGSMKVDGSGVLQTANSIQLSEESLQEKEEQKEEEPGVAQLSVVQKQHDTSIYCKCEGCSEDEESVQRKPQTILNTGFGMDTSSGNSGGYSAIPVLTHGRGPPVISRSPVKVQRSVVDTALSAVSLGSLTDCVGIDLNQAKTCLLRKAQQVALNIPGYRALRVVLGQDPITGQPIDRSGQNFIEAAFDIMPGGRNLHRKLQEQHQLDAAAAWINGRIGRIETIVNGLFSRFDRFWNGLGLSDLSSPMDVMRQGAVIVAGFISDIVDFAVETGRKLLEMVKDFLLSEIVGFIRERTPAYPLLTVILGHDPITGQDVARNGTNILNALLELGGEEGRMQRDQMIETGTFQRIVGFIDEGIAVFEGAYEEIVAAFHNIWTEVTIDSLMNPVATFQRISSQFAGPVRRVLNFVIRVAAAILAFIKEVLMRRLSAWAREQRGFELVTVIIGRDPFTGDLVPRTMENIIRGFMSLMPGGREQFEQLEESGVIGRAAARINAAVARLNMTPAYIIQLFTELWNSFSLADLANPIAAFQRIIARFGEPILRLVAFVWQIVKIVIELILQAMNFPFDLINNIITRAMSAIESIKRDPVGFLKNLLRAIKQGFLQFFDNIVTHLMNGVIGWLMSELRDANVPIPTDFTLQGIISWVLEVLGISMEAIWAKLAAHPRIGPERVARIRGMIDTLEGIWTFIKDVQERGMAAIWDKIQEQLTNLWDTVLDAVKNWIMDTIITRVTTRLLSMLDPTGIMAVINSAIAIYNAIQSFIRYLREMLEIINSFVNGVADIAAGNVTTAANYLERTMGQAMPIVIGFLANQVGLAGVGRRIAEIIASIRGLVDRALTWLVDRAVNLGMNLLDRAMALGRSAVSAVAGWFGIRKGFTTTDGEQHSIYVQGSDAAADIFVASRNPKTIDRLLAEVSYVIHQPSNSSNVNTYNEAVGINGRIITLKGRLRNNGNPTQQQDYESLNAEITAISTKLPTLMMLIGGTEPPPLLKPAFGDNIKATGFKVHYLKRGRVSGGAPAHTHRGNLGGWTEVQQAGLSEGAAWVKMHLLTEQLGGPALDANLTPADGPATNIRFRDSVEHPAVAEVNAGKVIWYDVSVSYGTGANLNYINNITMEYGPYQFNNSSNVWEEKPRGFVIDGEPVGKRDSKDTNPPNLTGAIQLLNLNSEAGRVRIQSISSLFDRQFAEFVLSVLNSLPNGFRTTVHLRNQLQISYNSRPIEISNFVRKVNTLVAAYNTQYWFGPKS